MKKCPFCSALIKETHHSCDACKKTLIKNFEMATDIRANGYPLRPYQRPRRRRYRFWLSVFAGLGFSLLVALGYV